MKKRVISGWIESSYSINEIIDDFLLDDIAFRTKQGCIDSLCAPQNDIDPHATPKRIKITIEVE